MRASASSKIVSCVWCHVCAILLSAKEAEIGAKNQNLHQSLVDQETSSHCMLMANKVKEGLSAEKGLYPGQYRG